MNQLSPKERSRILSCLVEGNSMRATQRMTGFAKKTVERALREIGESCQQLCDERMTNLPCVNIQCDEIWSFTYAKEKNVPQHLRGTGAGDTWTWVAIDRDTKLIPAWFVGDRTAQSAYRLMRNLSPRLANRIQLTTDGHRAYLIAVQAAFAHTPIDYGMLVKLYGDSTAEGRYSPGEVIGTEIEVIRGKSDPAQKTHDFHARRNGRVRSNPLFWRSFGDSKKDENKLLHMRKRLRILRA